MSFMGDLVDLNLLEYSLRDLLIKTPQDQACPHILSDIFDFFFVDFPDSTNQAVRPQFYVSFYVLMSVAGLHCLVWCFLNKSK